MNDQQIRQRRQTELSRALMRAIAQYADANTNPRVDDGVVFNALMHTLVELLAHTSGFNRDNALRLFGPEVARKVERCSLHYAQPRGAG
jgi:hypothetical protein